MYKVDLWRLYVPAAEYWLVILVNGGEKVK